jgi:beta-lactamase superfamily II metal-dependent hydrolase
MAIAALCGSASPAAISDPQLRMVLIDMEGGGGALYVTPEGKSLLIDAGWTAGMPDEAPASPTSASRVVKAARALGVRRIDTLIVSHFHADHVGGVAELLRSMPVGTIIDYGASLEPKRPGSNPRVTPSDLFKEYLPVVAGRKRVLAKPGDHFRIGSLRIHIVNAAGRVMAGNLPGGGQSVAGCATMTDRGAPTTNENDASIGVVASFGKARILNLSDSTWKIEKQLVCPANKLGRIDLMVVSHHGSSLSNSPQLYEAVRPRVALLGNGETKGGDRQVLETLAMAPSRPAVWQLHSATKSPELDVAAERIANPAGRPDGAYGIEARVSADGTIQVTNQGSGFSVTYPAGR